MRQDPEPETWQAPEPEPERLDIHPAWPRRRAVTVVGITIAIMLAVVLSDQIIRLPVSFFDHGPSQRSASRAVARRAPTPSASPMRFDTATGEFLADGLQGTLPASWFTYQNGYITIGTGAGGCLGDRCRPDVAGQHPLEDNIPWGAEFEIVTVEHSLTGKNIDQTADRILNYWIRYAIYYADTSEPVVVKNKSERTLTANLPRPARMITAELHYRKPGLNVRDDHFYLVVVGGTTGQYTAYVAAWSNNTTADAVHAIQNSINTLRVD